MSDSATPWTAACQDPLSIRWVWRNGRGPHLEGRQEPQASPAFRTLTAGWFPHLPLGNLVTASNLSELQSLYNVKDWIKVSHQNLAGPGSQAVLAALPSMAGLESESFQERVDAEKRLQLNRACRTMEAP